METFEVKNPTTYKEQLEIMSSRGCIINDPDFCEDVLARVNYYRLSAYFLPFKNPDDSFRDNISFERIFRIYEFDRGLRGLLSSALEVAEINLRSRLAYFHAHKYGRMGYLDEENFNQRHMHTDYHERITAVLRANRTVPFVRHHYEKYGGQFPIWVIIELFTFGMLSYFYADLKQADQRALSQIIAGSTAQNIISWLRCCTDLRNICAHYGRLYYRKFTSVPASLPLSMKDSERRLFSAIWALKQLYPDQDVWRQELIHPLSLLITEYEKDINLKHIGFPYGWESILMQ